MGSLSDQQPVRRHPVSLKHFRTYLGAYGLPPHSVDVRGILIVPKMTITKVFTLIQAELH